METFSKEITFSTSKKREIIDMTDEVTSFFEGSGIENGILIAQVPHTTAMLVLNENESGVKQDILSKLNEFAPPKADYKHDRIDNNAHAHIKGALVGSSEVLPIVDGKLVKGTWQSFLVIEQDGPRSERNLVISVIGE